MPSTAVARRLPQWKRTQFAIVASVFLWFAGQNFLLPFLPLYIRELGDLSVAETGVWSGVILSVTPLVSGSLAPVWGVVADRFGRKLMVQRSLVGFALCLGLMGLAQEPWHLLAIRTGMGVFGGFAAAASAIVTTTGPPESITSGVGRVQSARVLGLALGPLPGGVFADLVGYRGACFVSMSAAVLAFLVVTLLTRDDAHGLVRRARAEEGAERDRSARRQLLAGGFLSIFIVSAVIRTAEKSFDPVLPLLIGEMDPAGIGVASATAAITSAGLFSAAVASSLTDRFLGAWSRDTGMRVVLPLAALAFLAIFFAPNWGTVLALRILVGLCLGAGLTLAFSAIAAETPRDRRGLVLGMLGAGTSYGSSAGSALGGLLTPISLGLVFLVDGVLLLCAASVQHVFRGRHAEELTR